MGVGARVRRAAMALLAVVTAGLVMGQAEPWVQIYAVNPNPVTGGGVGTDFWSNGVFHIAQIDTYHWNGGKGVTSARIRIQNGDGNAQHINYSGQAVGSQPVPGGGYVAWSVYPNLDVVALNPANPSIFWQVVVDDADHATWSTNAQAGGAGFFVLHLKPGPAPPFPAGAMAAPGAGGTTTTPGGESSTAGGGAGVRLPAGVRAAPIGSAAAVAIAAAVNRPTATATIVGGKTGGVGQAAHGPAGYAGVGPVTGPALVAATVLPTCALNPSVPICPQGPTQLAAGETMTIFVQKPLAGPFARLGFGPLHGAASLYVTPVLVSGDRTSVGSRYRVSVPKSVCQAAKLNRAGGWVSLWAYTNRNFILMWSDTAKSC